MPMLQHDESLRLHVTGARRTPVFASAQTRSETINSAFVTAYLLTGSAAVSEASVEEAIEKWDPSSGAPALIREAAKAALSRKAEYSNDFPVPGLLRRVVELPECMRRCFVLRGLLGLTAATAAGLLCLSADHVDRCASSAMRSLAGQRAAVTTRR